MPRTRLFLGREPRGDGDYDELLRFARAVTLADVERLDLRHSITPARVREMRAVRHPELRAQTIPAGGGVWGPQVGDSGWPPGIEIATLVRVAAACGYQVGISLEPLSPGMRAFSTVLQGTTR